MPLVFSPQGNIYNNKNSEFTLKTFAQSCEFRQVPEPILCESLETPYLSYLE